MFLASVSGLDHSGKSLDTQTLYLNVCLIKIFWYLIFLLLVRYQQYNKGKCLYQV